MTNSFKDLEEDLIAKHGEPPGLVKEKIDGTFRVFHFVGDIMELYISKLVQLLISLSGGKDKETD